MYLAEMTEKLITSTCFVCLNEHSGVNLESRQVLCEALKHYFALLMLKRLDSFVQLLSCRKTCNILFVDVKNMNDLLPASKFEPERFHTTALGSYQSLVPLLSVHTDKPARRVLQTEISLLKDEEFLLIMSLSQTGELVGGASFPEKSRDALHLLSQGKERYELVQGVKIPFGEKMENPTECSRCGKYKVVLEPCARCGTAFYCSGACQHTHWKLHKPFCHATVSLRAWEHLQARLNSSRKPNTKRKTRTSPY